MQIVIYFKVENNKVFNICLYFYDNDEELQIFRQIIGVYQDNVDDEQQWFKVFSVG